MLQRLTDTVRSAVWNVLSSTRGDDVRAVKVVREVLGTANDLAGRPFAPRDEIERRRERRAGGAATEKRREPAPVMLYFDGKDHRTLRKMEETLRAREVPYKVLDVTDDEASRSWAVTAARRDELPLLFIAGEPVGGLHELTQLDVNGGLRRRVFGA